jgi:hypothetical protein
MRHAGAQHPLSPPSALSGTSGFGRRYRRRVAGTGARKRALTARLVSRFPVSTSVSSFGMASANLPPSRSSGFRSRQEVGEGRAEARARWVRYVTERVRYPHFAARAGTRPPVRDASGVVPGACAGEGVPPSPSPMRAMRLLLSSSVRRRGRRLKPSSRTTSLSDRSMQSNWFSVAPVFSIDEILLPDVPIAVTVSSFASLSMCKPVAVNQHQRWRSIHARHRAGAGHVWMSLGAEGLSSRRRPHGCTAHSNVYSPRPLEQ